MENVLGVISLLVVCFGIGYNFIQFEKEMERASYRNHFVPFLVGVIRLVFLLGLVYLNVLIIQKLWL